MVDVNYSLELSASAPTRGGVSTVAVVAVAASAVDIPDSRFGFADAGDDAVEFVEF